MDVTANAKGYTCKQYSNDDPNSFNPNFLYQVNGDANTGVCEVTANWTWSILEWNALDNGMMTLKFIFYFLF